MLILIAPAAGFIIVFCCISFGGGGGGGGGGGESFGENELTFARLGKFWGKKKKPFLFKVFF